VYGTNNMRLAALDYETQSIENRPAYPPAPVGCSLYPEGGKPIYLAWGHPLNNNTTRARATKDIRAFIKSHAIICHNLAFDHDVGEVHLGLPIIGKTEYHDTELLAYLNNPREESLALKRLADTWLDMPPDEQAALRLWIMANVTPPLGKKLTASNWGAYIAQAPGKLVGRYAKGDTIRTLKLFKLLHPLIKQMGMLDAYARELKLIRIKLKMERSGLLTAQTRLKRDLPKFENLRTKLNGRIKSRLKITKKLEATLPKGVFNLNSSKQVADALEASGKIDPTRWIYTQPSDTHPKGQRSTSLQNLIPICKDKRLMLDMGMHSVIDTYCNTFFSAWIDAGTAGNGRIHPTFNLIRTTDEHGGRGTRGTKTGRPSVSKPNFNNIPVDVSESKNRDVLMALASLLLTEYNLEFLGMRDYIVPDKGCVFIDRDYAQQEMRVLAHYENGALMDAMLANPKMNVHHMVRGLILDIVGIDLPHKAVKIIAFMVIYGGGVDALAEALGTDRDTARKMKSVYMDAMPGVADLSSELKAMVKQNVPMRTYGGRLYTCEPPQYSRQHRRWMDFDYKMLNLLIQGSAADLTKQAMLQVDAAGLDIRLQVYDQMVVNSARGNWRKEMSLMREAMEDLQLDVSLPTDGAWSGKSWAQLKPFKDPT